MSNINSAFIPEVHAHEHNPCVSGKETFWTGNSQKSMSILASLDPCEDQDGSFCGKSGQYIRNMSYAQVVGSTCPDGDFWNQETQSSVRSHASLSEFRSDNAYVDYAHFVPDYCPMSGDSGTFPNDRPSIVLCLSSLLR